MTAVGCSQSSEITPNKYEIDALDRALFIMMSIAFGDEVGAGKVRIGTSVRRGTDGQLDVTSTVEVVAGDSDSYLNRGGDLILHPCKYLDLADANDRLAASQNRAGIPSLPYQSMRQDIETTKMVLDCREGLSPGQLESIEKGRPRWDYFRGRAYVKLRVVRGAAGPEEQVIATSIVKFKGNENE